MAVAESTCVVDGCGRTRTRRDYCDVHYQRVRKTGDPGPAAALALLPRKQCSVNGCDKPVKARSWCRTHYERWQRFGEPGPASLSCKPVPPCRASNCTKSAEIRGFCEAHNRRYLRYGDPDIVVYSRWRGADAGYGAVHDRLRRVRGLAETLPCKRCDNMANEWVYDHSDPAVMYEPKIGMPYSTNLDRYIPLCRWCHRSLDIAMSPATISSAVERKAVRDWARRNGWPVGSKGPLARRVVMAYREARQ